MSVINYIYSVNCHWVRLSRRAAVPSDQMPAQRHTHQLQCHDSIDVHHRCLSPWQKEVSKLQCGVLLAHLVLFRALHRAPIRIPSKLNIHKTSDV